MRLERDWNEAVTRQIVFFSLKLLERIKETTGLQHFRTKKKKAIHSPMFNHHSLIPWGSFRGRQEEKWESFRGRFGDHFRVGDHFGVGIISGAVQFSLPLSSSFLGISRGGSMGRVQGVRTNPLFLR